MASTISFTRFCERVNVILEPGQRVLAKVAFDGIEPRDLEGEERAIAARLFGPDVHVVPANARNVIVLVIGGRSGKSYIFCAVHALYLALTVPLRATGDLAPGERASVNIIGPNLSLANQTLRFVKGICDTVPEVKRQVVHCEPNSPEIVLQRGSFQVTITCRAANGKGVSGRGRTLLGAVLDEAAFFRDATSKVNDADIYAANVPRIMSGGKAVIPSTPWAESGLLYELWRDNWNRPTTCLVAHAPTRLMRTNARILAEVDREYARNEDNARREFGAEFMSSGTELLFDANSLRAAEDKSLVNGALPRPGAFVSAGADPGFVHDAAALVISHRYEEQDELGLLHEQLPEPGSPLKPSVVFREFVRLARPHGVRGITSDAHYREALREATDAAGVNLYDAPMRPIDAFLRMKTLLAEGRIRWPADAHFAAQMREVRRKATPGGGMSVYLPRVPGAGHCDLASAAVLATWSPWEDGIEAPAPRPGTVAWGKREEERFEEAARERLAKRAGEHDEGLYGPAWSDDEV